ncbi:hypothetical protein JCM10207_006751 [Rhodosporidiobolus poonsookiae]
MGRISISSPPTSPTFAAAMAPTSTRSRFRPLPTLAFLALHACLFYYYHTSLRQARTTTSVPLRSSGLQLSTTSGSDPTTNLAAAVPSLATSSCEVCHLDPTNPLCQYGLDSIRQSRAYEGSGARIRRVLAKALRGEEIGIGILGASVTQGHSVPPGLPRWQEQFLNDFKLLFPTAKMYTGAVGAMDSRFFAYCFEALVPKDLDIYFVETDINNDPSLRTLKDDDGLMRALLQLPQEPAVVRVSTFALLFPELARGAMSSLITSQLFDVPVIGIRNFLLPHTIHHREAADGIFGLDQWGNRDYRHIGPAGHVALGDMVALFMRKEVCETQRRAILPPVDLPKVGPWPGEEDLGKIPPLALWSSWLRPVNLDPITPMCRVTGSPLSPLEPHSHSPTFKLIEWNGKAAWGATQPGSQIRFKFTGTKIGLFVWATPGTGPDEVSPDMKLRQQNAPGQAMCWVEDPDMSEAEWDEKYGNAPMPEAQSWLVNAHWPEKAASGPEFVELAEDLHPGNHILACEVSRESSTGGYKWMMQGIASQ